MQLCLAVLFAALPTQVPSATAESELGWVRIVTEPAGATVLIDGEPIQSADRTPSRTPIGAVRLRLDRAHKLTLVKEGYETLVVPLTLSKETSGQLVHQRLRREGGPLALPRPVPAPAPRKLDGPCTSDETQTGMLSLSAKRYGVVYLGEERLGETPLLKVRIPVGCTELRVIQPESRVEKTVRVHIEANKISRYTMAL